MEDEPIAAFKEQKEVTALFSCEQSGQPFSGKISHIPACIARDEMREKRPMYFWMIPIEVIICHRASNIISIENLCLLLNLLDKLLFLAGKGFYRKGEHPAFFLTLF
ncbi:hypothetical protein D1872_219650 [compost metagenome]